MRTALALAALLALPGCVVASGGCPAVPAMPAEAMPKPPVAEPAPTWQPGHVDWDGTRYSFVPGRWILRTGPDTMWMPAHWERDPGEAACRWVPAHWL
jgi:hypothetical protein